MFAWFHCQFCKWTSKQFPPIPINPPNSTTANSYIKTAKNYAIKIEFVVFLKFHTPIVQKDSLSDFDEYFLQDCIQFSSYPIFATKRDPSSSRGLTAL
jgi:hypothetical protein